MPAASLQVRPKESLYVGTAGQVGTALAGGWGLPVEHCHYDTLLGPRMASGIDLLNRSRASGKGVSVTLLAASAAVDCIICHAKPAERSLDSVCRPALHYGCG